MASSLASRRQHTKIVQRIAELEQTIFEMRSNQVNKITYGNIVIDGTGAQGVITIGNGITITVDSNGNGLITVGNITISGTGTITVTDGTNKRVLIGYESGGF